MIPSPIRSESIERTDEYLDFIQKVAAYHRQRGTPFDPEPRVGSRHVDLLRLYKLVMSRGGYDAVSGEKLAWRTLGFDFHLGTSNLPALAFNLKTTYYKYLSAYEISTFHGKEPPPREILEDVSARGGDLLNRTLENYKGYGNRDVGAVAHEEHDGSGDTPKTDGASEDYGSGNRASRGLRQAPPQRVLFQPDMSSSRQPRAPRHLNSPQPRVIHVPNPMSSTSWGTNPANPKATNFDLDIYEPRNSAPMTVLTLPTPRTNAAAFEERNRQLREAHDQRQQALSAFNGVMLPGTGYAGKNIYLRCLLSLRSGIESDVAYALHHMVKISYERGDKYRFEQFPGLAEGLVEESLRAASLFSDARWNIDYTGDGDTNDPNHLDGIYGTSDILDRIDRHQEYELSDELLDEEFDARRQRSSEASLILRNLVLMPDNARFVSLVPAFRDLIVILLRLPDHSAASELKQYAVEMAAEVSKYYPMAHTDPLVRVLLEILQGQDRGAIIAALRALSRASWEVERINTLQDAPRPVIENVCNWLLLDDDELVFGALDFLYLFTRDLGNMVDLLRSSLLTPTVNHLVRLLSYGTKQVNEYELIKPAVKGKRPTHGLKLPETFLRQLLQFNEPERSSLWLKACFEHDPEAEITQVKLWQEYKDTFLPHDENDLGKFTLAAEFIKNVSHTFGEKHAKAEIVTDPQGNTRFIIRGLRYRRKPLDIHKKEWIQCWWETGPTFSTPNSHFCHQFFQNEQSLWEHMLTSHAKAARVEGSGKWQSPNAIHFCRWDGCNRFRKEGTPNLSVLASHLYQHLPDKHRKDPHYDDGSKEAVYEQKTYSDTPWEEIRDEQNKVHRQPKGVSFGSVIVLLNIAKGIQMVEPPVGGSDKLHQTFAGLQERIAERATADRVLRPWICELMMNVV